MSRSPAVYPFECIVAGTPRTPQTKSSKSREDWKDRVRNAASKRLSLLKLKTPDKRPIAASIYYFTPDPMTGDIDNIIKPILDALNGIAYIDDSAIERVIAQKFERGMGCKVEEPSDVLVEAIEHEGPVVYIRIDDDLSWRTIR